ETQGVSGAEQSEVIRGAIAPRTKTRQHVFFANPPFPPISHGAVRRARGWQAILKWFSRRRAGGEDHMTKFASIDMLLLGGALSLLVSTSSAQIGGQSRPNFASNGWLNQGTFGGGALLPAPGTPSDF